MMETMRRIRWAAGVFGVWVVAAVAALAAPGPWDQPAAALADKIAGLLGPGQAHLVLLNRSSIPASELPAIRKLLEDDLRTHGVTPADEESANTMRVTLSESARTRLWVAEVVEGNVTQVAMVEAGSAAAQLSAAPGGLALRRQAILTANEPILAALETPSGVVVLEPEQVVLYTRGSDGWRVFKSIDVAQKQLLARDPRGLLTQDAAGNGFKAWLAGAQCIGALPVGEGAVNCHASDDPWPIPSSTSSASTLSAFYNPARNFFTGVVTPNLNVDLPRFYAAAWMPRAAGGAGLVVGGMDGKVQMLENGAVKPIAGTRDWGSDFAALNTGCGSGWQVVASGSGEAAGDSLRAFEVPALEAIPASAPLEVNGSVTALWPAPDAKSAIAVVRSATGAYEVDRVTALCN